MVDILLILAAAVVVVLIAEYTYKKGYRDAVDDLLSMEDDCFCDDCFKLEEDILFGDEIIEKTPVDNGIVVVVGDKKKTKKKAAKKTAKKKSK